MNRNLLFFCLLLIPVLVSASPTGPHNVYANNPPNYLNCTQCHNSYPLNSGDGSYYLTGLPAEYVPGQAYDITVNLEDPDQQKWGFQLAMQLEDNSQGGSIVLPDPLLMQNFWLMPGIGVMHTEAGNYAGTFHASPGWEVEWTAPDAGSGTVTFYGSGNAGNNRSATAGDYIYTLEVAVPEYVAPPDPVEYLVIAVSGDNVILTWTVAAGAAEYNIYRSEDPYFEPSGVPYQTVTGTSFSDYGAVTAGVYFYIVTAAN